MIVEQIWRNIDYLRIYVNCFIQWPDIFAILATDKDNFESEAILHWDVKFGQKG